MSKMVEIWKFELQITSGQQVFNIASDAEVLSVQMQNNVIVFWIPVVVDPPQFRRKRTFVMRATGQRYDYDLHVKQKYIGTVQDGSFVWHFFEVIDG